MERYSILIALLSIMFISCGDKTTTAMNDDDNACGITEEDTRMLDSLIFHELED